MTGLEHRLAISRADNSIAVLAASDDGKAWDEAYSGEGWWPTWRPGTSQLATSVVTRPTSTGGRTVLQLLDLTSGGRLDIPGSTNAPARLIADRLAHYALWSPDGRMVSYVCPAGRALASRIWETGESGERTVMGGAPIFTTWSTDSRRVAVHHGGSLTVVDTAVWAEQRISDNAAGFRTALFLRDAIVFAEPGPTFVRVVMTSLLDGSRSEGPLVNGGVAFAPQPNGDTVLLGITPGDEAGVFSEILRFDPEQPDEKPRRFLKGPMMAFWWSPDGSRLAILAPSYTGDGRFQVRFHGADGTFERAMEATTLSQDMRTLVSFFDQYALSHALWSADGRYFAVSGRLLTDGPHASFTGSNLDCVLVADLHEPGPWLNAGHGLAGFFPR